MKIMNRIVFFIVLSTILCLDAAGQPGHNRQQRMERYRAMKIAYFTDNLDLTQEEAEKFWPIYNAHHEKKDKLMRERWVRRRNIDNHLDTLSEESAKGILENHVRILEEATRMDTRLQEDLLEFLAPSKVVTLYITEIRFREHMLRTLREERKKGEDSRRR